MGGETHLNIVDMTSYMDRGTILEISALVIYFLYQEMDKILENSHHVYKGSERTVNSYVPCIETHCVGHGQHAKCPGRKTKENLTNERDNNHESTNQEEISTQSTKLAFPFIEDIETIPTTTGVSTKVTEIATVTATHDEINENDESPEFSADNSQK